MGAGAEGDSAGPAAARVPPAPRRQRRDGHVSGEHTNEILEAAIIVLKVQAQETLHVWGPASHQ